jgi:hypothetical protein
MRAVRASPSELLMCAQFNTNGVILAIVTAIDIAMAVAYDGASSLNN